MVIFNFTNPKDGLVYFVRGPDGLTRLRAQQIFQEQLDSGSLIGLEPGQTITAEKQLADGLLAAEPEVIQTLRAATQSGVIAGAVQQAGTGLLTLSNTPVTNGITVADYNKQNRAQGSIRKLDLPAVTGLLAQIRNLTQQDYSVATNMGVGQYAFTVSQLERAGYVTPGTAANYLTTGQISPLGVLQAGGVWTGQDGIATIQNFLSSDVLQDQAQQALMTVGLNQMVELGVPVDTLSAQEQGAIAVLAAVDPIKALAWLSGRDSGVVTIIGPVPDTSGQNWLYFNKIYRDMVYAVDFSLNKTNAAMKNEIPAPAYSGITERQAIDSAVTRIIGNEKIPTFDYGSVMVDPAQVAELDTLVQQLNQLNLQVTSLTLVVPTTVNGQGKLGQINTLLQELQTVQQNLLSLQAQALLAAAPSAEFLNTVLAQLTQTASLLERLQQEKAFVARVLGVRLTV